LRQVLLFSEYYSNRFMQPGATSTCVIVLWGAVGVLGVRWDEGLMGWGGVSARWRVWVTNAWTCRSFWQTRAYVTWRDSDV